VEGGREGGEAVLHVIFDKNVVPVVVRWLSYLLWLRLQVALWVEIQFIS